MKKSGRRFLLLSAYDAVSHKLWRERLTSLFAEDHWSQLTLSPRHFSWRIRGNSLLWALTEKALLEQPYDLLIATSMVDLSALRGFVPALAEIPTLLYFHENQFAYPKNKQTRPNVEHQLVPLYSAFCADEIAFNSHYNRNTFLAGAKSLCKQLPDKIPAAFFGQLTQSSVLPVPLNVFTCVEREKTQSHLELVWNHRWEYDKWPELLLKVILKATEAKLPIRFHIVGEKFSKVPSQFSDIISRLKAFSEQSGIELGQLGYVESQTEYNRLLGNCDVVLSTALHDFQGLAIQEACLAGCIPLAPNDLAYPDYLPESCLYPRQGSDEATAEIILQSLRLLIASKSKDSMPPPIDLSLYQGDEIAAAYEDVFNKMLAKRTC